MASLRYLTFPVFICLICVTLSNSEIHRAKPNSPKYGVKSHNSYEQSYVAQGVDISEEDTLLKHRDRTTMDESKLETWVFSIFGAMLVGLSGIFPLLVIPIEAGPALKHGGKSCLSFT